MCIPKGMGSRITEQGGGPLGELDVEQEIHYINYASTHALEANVSGICNIEVLRNMLYTTVQNPEGSTNQAFSCYLQFLMFS